MLHDADVMIHRRVFLVARQRVRRRKKEKGVNAGEKR